MIPCDVTKPVQLRKFSNETDTLGRLEVCYNGYWSSVCKHYASMDANVVCRELGHAGKGLEAHIIILCVDIVALTYYSLYLYILQAMCSLWLIMTSMLVFPSYPC